MTDFLECIQIFIVYVLSYAAIGIIIMAFLKLAELILDLKNRIFKKKDRIIQTSPTPYIPSLAEELAKNYESDYDRFYWEKKKTGEGWTDEEIKIAWENRGIGTTLYCDNGPYMIIYDNITINEARQLLATKSDSITEYPSERKEKDEYDERCTDKAD